MNHLFDSLLRGGRIACFLCLAGLLTRPAVAQTLDWQSAASLIPTAASGTSLVRGLAIDSAGVQYLTGDFSGTLTLGSTTLTSAGSTDVFVAARSAAGTWLWASRGGGANEDRSFAITVAGQGSTAQVFITGGGNTTVPLTFGGTTLPAGAAQSVFVAALSGSGSWAWAKAGGTGGVGAVAGRGIAVAGRGSAARVYVTGTTGSTTWGSLVLTGTPVPMAYVAFVAALDAGGNWLWGCYAGGAGTVSGYFMHFGQLGNIQHDENRTFTTVGSSGLSLAVVGSGAGTQLYVTGTVSAYTYNAGNRNGSFTASPGPAYFGTTAVTGTTGAAFAAALDATGTWRWVKILGTTSRVQASFTKRIKYTETDPIAGPRYQYSTTTGPLNPTGTSFIYGKLGGLVALGSGSAARVCVTGTASLAALGAATTGSGTGFVAALTSSGAYRWGRLTNTTPTSLALLGGAAPRLAITGTCGTAAFGSLGLTNGAPFVAVLDTSGTWQSVQRAAGGSSTAIAPALTAPNQLVVAGSFGSAAPTSATLTAGGTTLTTAATSTGWLGTLALNPSGPTVQFTAISPGSGPVGSAVTLTGSNLHLVTSVSFNGTAVPAGSFVSQSAMTITLAVPAGASTGAVVAAMSSGVGAALSFTVTTPTRLPVVVNTGSVATPTPVPAGSYSSLTVTGTGVARLDGAADVSTAVVVQAGGTLLTNCQPLTGPGSFTLAAGATLGICDPAGLSATAGTGAVQLTGARSFSAQAAYLYNGSAAQATGDALPDTVRALTSTNAQPLVLTQPLNISQTLTVAGAGDFDLNGQPLTLLSDAGGTALLALTGAGTVSGSTGVMQRHLETNAAASGYRHYASPVQGETVNTLATAGYVPSFASAAAYNSSPTPSLIMPFPTVFGYDQDRIAGTTSTYTGFDKGWRAALGGEALAPGRAVTAQAPGAALVDFEGTFTAGPVAVTGLGRGTDAEAGWHLLGNPYPAPLDWSTMTIGAGQSLENMGAAVYVFQSSGPYAGQYRTFLANMPGAGEPLIPAGSGFFVRTSAPGVAGTVRFANANRVTSFGAQPAFGRGNDLRPALTLALQGASGPADALTLYADAAATADVDAQHDATKLANPSGLNLASLTATGAALAIDGRPVLSGRIPLSVAVPAAGRYTLTAVLANVPVGTGATLTDALTGQTTDLRTAPTYTFTATANASATGRFFLNLPAVGTALANSIQALIRSITVYPNPVRDAATVSGLTAGAAVQVFDALGRRVTAATADAAGTARLALPTGLAAGVYVVRSGSQVQRLAVE